MTVTVAAVGSALGHKGQIFAPQPQAQIFRQFFKHVVGHEAQPLVPKLQGGVAVAKVIAGAGQGFPVGGNARHHRFRAVAHDCQHVPGAQNIALAQNLPAREKQPRFFAAVQPQTLAAFAALLLGQGEGGRRLQIGALPHVFGKFQHGRSLGCLPRTKNTVAPAAALPPERR